MNWPTNNLGVGRSLRKTSRGSVYTCRPSTTNKNTAHLSIKKNIIFVCNGLYVYTYIEREGERYSKLQLHIFFRVLCLHLLQG